VTTAGASEPLRARDSPKEPYPALSLIAAALLGGATLLLLAFFGLVGIILDGAPTESRMLFAVLAALAIAMPLIGLRALFGSHFYSLVALTALGFLFLGGGYVAEPLGGGPLTTFAIGPAVLALAVASFGWWKWATKSRFIDLRSGADRG